MDGKNKKGKFLMCTRNIRMSMRMFLTAKLIHGETIHCPYMANDVTHHVSQVTRITFIGSLRVGIRVDEK